MNYRAQIKAPVISEKAYAQMEKGIYAFLVDPKATKKTIADTIEKHFSVNVEKINVLKIKAQTKRIAATRRTTQIGEGKKAIVWLAKGQSIPILLPKSEKAPKKKDTRHAATEADGDVGQAKVSKESEESKEMKHKSKGIFERFRRTK